MPAPRPTLSEKALQSAVIDTARIFGWRVAHFRTVPVKRGPRVIWETPVQADGAGFPDLVLVRDGVLWVELKVGGNTLSDAQAAWARALDLAGAEYHVWTDREWLDGVIESRLRRKQTDAA
jgi:hypothetical protein